MTKRSERKPGYFALIPAEVRYDTALAPNAKLLFGEITALAGADGYCWASNDYFAKLYKMDKRTISRLIGQLQERGHVQVEVISKGEKAENGQLEYRRIYIGKRLTNAAKGIDKNVHTPTTKLSTGYGQNCHGGIDKNIPPFKCIINNNNITPIPPKGDAAQFDLFWDRYPKKKAKAKARQAWEKLKADETLFHAILAALDAQRKSASWQREAGRYIPYPATWLNQRRWEDDPEPPAPAAAPAVRTGGEYGWQ